jgi:hypothetical protein
LAFIEGRITMKAFMNVLADYRSKAPRIKKKSKEKSKNRNNMIKEG